MIGALLGVSNLPTDMLGKLMEFDCTQEYTCPYTGEKIGKKRDEWLSVKKVGWELIKSVVDYSPPSSLESPLVIIETKNSY